VSRQIAAAEETARASEEPVKETVTIDAQPAPDATATEDFSAVLQRVEEASRAWNIQSDLPEGKFVAAMMGAIGWSGRVTQAAQAEFRAISKSARDAAELELARAREITKAANAALGQARNAMIGLEIERESVVGRIVQEAMPQVAVQLRTALVIREKAWNDGVKFRRLLAAGAITLGVFGCGYALRAWSDADAVAAQGAMLRCLARVVQAEGHVYCDVTAFHGAIR